MEAHVAENWLRARALLVTTFLCALCCSSFVDSNATKLWSASKMAVWMTVMAGVLVAAGFVLKRTVFSDVIDAGQVSQGWLRQLRAAKQEGLRS